MRNISECKLFVIIVCKSYDWSKPFNTWQHPLKMELKYILFCRLPFCMLMHSMYENENIPIWGKHILCHNKRSCFPLYPDYYLKSFSFNNHYISSNISNMRCSVSSPDETPRRELKIWRAAEYFWRTSRCFIWWWNTVSNVWYFFSNKIIFEGEIKDANTEQFFIRFPNTH